MKVKIVGIVPQDYTLDNGYSFKGQKIHAIDLETAVEGQLGNQCMDFKIAGDHPLASVPLKVGAEYNLYFTKKGQVDFLAEVK